MKWFLITLGVVVLFGVRDPGGGVAVSTSGVRDPGGGCTVVAVEYGPRGVRGPRIDGTRLVWECEGKR